MISAVWATIFPVVNRSNAHESPEQILHEWCHDEFISRDEQIRRVLAKEEILPHFDRTQPGLYVRGSLNLSYYSCLTALPPGLTVEGDLTLRGLRSLESLPDDLIFGGNLDLSHCVNLKSLPGWIFDLPFRADGKPHVIYLIGIELSESMLEDIKAMSNPAVQFAMRP